MMRLKVTIPEGIRSATTFTHHAYSTDVQGVCGIALAEARVLLTSPNGDMKEDTTWVVISENNRSLPRLTNDSFSEPE